MCQNTRRVQNSTITSKIPHRPATLPATAYREQQQQQQQSGYSAPSEQYPNNEAIDLQLGQYYQASSGYIDTAAGDSSYQTGHADSYSCSEQYQSTEMIRYEFEAAFSEQYQSVTPTGYTAATGDTSCQNQTSTYADSYCLTTSEQYQNTELAELGKTSQSRQSNTTKRTLELCSCS